MKEQIMRNIFNLFGLGIEAAAIVSSVEPVRVADVACQGVVRGASKSKVFIPEQQEIPAIKLLHLPAEILINIMDKLDDESMLKLSLSCTQFRNIYQKICLFSLIHENAYKVWSHIGKVVIPAPNTDAWQSLNDKPLTAFLLGATHHSAWIEKLYITGWDLLLQPGVFNSRASVLTIMKLLLDLLPHISNAESYAAQLFPKAFPETFFQQLADTHLDRCLQLITKHFPVHYNSPAYNFMISQCSSLSSLRCLEAVKSGHYKSFLFYVVKNFHLFDIILPRQYEAINNLLDSLLRRGCDFEQIDEYNKPLLISLLDRVGTFEEVKYHDKKIQLCQLVERFFQYGADCNVSDQEGNTLLMKVCAYKIGELIPILLTQPKINAQAKNAQGENALHVAVASGDLSTVKALLDYPSSQIDINTRNVHGWTALHYAAESSNALIAQFLLDHQQVNVNIRNKEGNSALDIAMMCENWPVVKILVNDKKFLKTTSNNSESALHIAMVRNPWPSVEALLSHTRTDINIKNDKGSSALHVAVARGNLLRVQALLQHPKIDIHVINKQGENSLHIAVAHSNLPLVEILLDKKIEVNVKNKEGDSALHIAAASGNLAMVELLLQHPKIEPNLINNSHESALDKAVMRNDRRIVEALINHPQTHIYNKENENKSALYIAIARNYLSLINLLFKKADSNHTMHLSAFNYAIWLGKDEIANIFLADMNIKERGHFIEQAASLAIKKDQPEVVQILRNDYGYLELNPG